MLVIFLGVGYLQIPWIFFTGADETTTPRSSRHLLISGLWGLQDLRLGRGKQSQLDSSLVSKKDTNWPLAASVPPWLVTRREDDPLKHLLFSFPEKNPIKIELPLFHYSSICGFAISSGTFGPYPHPHTSSGGTLLSFSSRNFGTSTGQMAKTCLFERFLGMLPHPQPHGAHSGHPEDMEIAIYCPISMSIYPYLYLNIKPV